MAEELELEVEKRDMGSDWDMLLRLWPASGDTARDLLVKWHHRYSDNSPSYYNNDNQFKDCIQEAVDAVRLRARQRLQGCEPRGRFGLPDGGARGFLADPQLGARLRRCRSGLHH